VAARKAATGISAGASAHSSLRAARRCGSRELRRGRDGVAPALPRPDPAVPRSDLPASGVLVRSSSLPPSPPLPQLQKEKRSPRSSCSPLVRVTLAPHAGSDLHWSGSACSWARALSRHRLPPLQERCAAASCCRPSRLFWSSSGGGSVGGSAAAASTHLVVWPSRPSPSPEVGSGGVVLGRRGWHIFSAAAAFSSSTLRCYVHLTCRFQFRVLLPRYLMEEWSLDHGRKPYLASAGANMATSTGVIHLARGIAVIFILCENSVSVRRTILSLYY
jgi:hypothetical protein